jgi:excisionase family DNA binding protein
MKLITAKAASEMLNIRLQRLYELVRRGLIPHVKVGIRQLRFDSDELIAWTKRGGAVETKELCRTERRH